MKYVFGIILLLFIQILVAQDTLNLPKIQEQLKGIDNPNKQLEIVDGFIQRDSVELTSVSEPFLYNNFQLALKEKHWDQALLRLNILNNHYIFKALDNKKALQLCEAFYPYLKHCNSIKQRARFYINYAEANTYVQEFEASLNILNEGITYLEKQQDSTLFEFGYAYLKAGENSGKVNQFLKGVAHFEKASEIFLHQKDTLFYLWTQTGLSNLFSSNGLYEEAENTRKPVYTLGNQIPNKDVLTLAHLRASVDAFMQEQDSLEYVHIEQALESNANSKKSDISDIVNILTLSFATGTYARQDQLDRSDASLEALSKEIDKIENNPFLETYYTFGKSYNSFAHKNYTDTERLLLELLPKLKQAKEVSNWQQAQFLLSKTYEQLKQHENSLYHYKLYLNTKDSLTKTASRNKFAYVQTQFEVQKKDMEISKQQKNIQLLSAENKLKNQWLLLGGISVFGIFSILYLWKSRAFAKKKAELQKTFAQDLIRNVETERKRISSELHDSVGQSLLLIKNKIFLSSEKPDTQLIDNTIDEVRSISQSLHPFQFEKLGLVASIKNTVEAFQKNSTIFYSEAIEEDTFSLPKDKEIFVYRIIQECLNNVEKHSRAKACNVMAEGKKDFVLFQVKDNGVGFDSTETAELLDSLGMKTLKERAQIIGAQLSINSIKGKGTTVQLKVPRK